MVYLLILSAPKEKPKYLRETLNASLVVVLNTTVPVVVILLVGNLPVDPVGTVVACGDSNSKFPDPAIGDQ
ncbi:hypothetical protein D1872_302340 [compost metagenome]